MASTSSNQETSMQVATGESYQIKGRTMKLKGWQLTVQVENHVDFISLAHNGYELRNYFNTQDLNGYFKMLNGPIYENLVKYFWARDEIYDLHAARLEEHEQVIIDPTLEGKTREKLGLRPFTCTEIRSNVTGIPVFITEESIVKACRREVVGSFEENLDNKTSSWVEVVNMTLFNSKKKGKYCDMQKEHKLLQKIMTECLLPKGGGVNQPSLEHRLFLHFLITLEKTSGPKYIFNYLMWALKESKDNNISFVPYQRLLSEIIHQGGILKAIKA